MEVEMPVRTTSAPAGRAEQAEAHLVDQTRQEIRGLVHEIAHLSKSDVAPREFYREFLARVTTALAAAGAVVWTPGDGGLKAEYQTGLAEDDMGADAAQRRQHAQLLQRVVAAGEPLLVPPNSGASGDRDNPTAYLLLIVPVKCDREVRAVVEVFQRPGAGPTTSRGYLRFLVQMGDMAANFLQGRQLRHFTDRQALWGQVESFAREVHASLDPRLTAATIANEARRLVGCDRATVAVLHGRRAQVEAISGQEVFDRRATAVARLQRLASSVAATGESMWYAGDTSELAPQVEVALQAYVDHAHPKTVAVVPLACAPSADTAAPARPLGVLVLEHFDQSPPREEVLRQAELVAAHAATALGNALEHDRLFLMPLWKALGRAAWVVRARNLPKTLAAAVVAGACAAALALVPADFELEGRGTLEPVVRREVFAQIDGDITAVHVQHGNRVKKGALLAELRNVDLEVQLASLRGERSTTLERQSAVELALLGENKLWPSSATGCTASASSGSRSWPASTSSSP
jgi:transcriptional regulator with GAF, ATPase, and Fis domain